MLSIFIIFAILIPLSIIYTVWNEKRQTEENIRNLRAMDARTERVLKNWYTPPSEDYDSSCFHMSGGACQGCEKKYGKN